MWYGYSVRYLLPTDQKIRGACPVVTTETTVIIYYISYFDRPLTGRRAALAESDLYRAKYRQIHVYTCMYVSAARQVGFAHLISVYRKLLLALKDYTNIVLKDFS